MKILTTEDMRATDRATTEIAGISSLTLMENAGHAVARFALNELPEVDRAVVFCGKGNNGGDGFVAARILAGAGIDVTVLLLGTAAEVQGDAKEMLRRLPSPPIEAADEAALTSDAILKPLAGADVIIDAVFGTGFKPPLRGLALAVGALLEKYPGTPVVSIDMPSGWDADSRSFTAPGAYRSDAVVTFTAPKLAHVSGHLTQGGGLVRAGGLKQGPIVVAEIGSPPDIVQSSTGLTWTGSAKHLTHGPRNPDSNKGKFGHVLVASGARGRAGAPSMAAYGALRAGAGLVTAAVPDSILNTVALTTPELMTLPLIEGPNGCISARNLEPAHLKAMLEKITVIAIGPGLGQEPEAQRFALGLIDKDLIAGTDIPMVLDADCLNAIAEHKVQLDGSKRTLVLTPHPGEMARLVGKSIKEVQADREPLARAYATEHHVTLVLKGWRTIVAHPDGRLAINTTGNPGLAKGGSGDILTGIVAAMLAQYKDDVAQAVEAAVYLHGLAADFAVREQNEHTLLATDVVSHLFQAFNFQQRDKAGYIWLQGLPGTMQPESS